MGAERTLDALYVLIALQEIFFTKSAGKFWSKVKVKDNEKKAVGMFLVRTLGFFSLEYRIQEYCLACGIEVPKAMTYGALAGLEYFLSSFFITKHPERCRISCSILLRLLACILFVHHPCNAF